MNEQHAGAEYLGVGMASLDGALALLVECEASFRVADKNASGFLDQSEIAAALQQQLKKGEKFCSCTH